MNEEILNEIKAQLWSHLQYLIGRIKEIQSEYHTIKNWDWLGDQYNFCKSEIAYWKRVNL